MQTHHSYPMSHGMCREVGLEVSADRARVAVGACHLSPDGPQLGLLTAGTSCDGSPLLGAVHVHASLAHIEPRVTTVLSTLYLELQILFK